MGKGFLLSTEYDPLYIIRRKLSRQEWLSFLRFGYDMYAVLSDGKVAADNRR